MNLRLAITKDWTYEWDIKYTLVVLAIVATPFNLKILGPIRTLDIILLVLIAIGFKDYKLKATTFQIYVALIVLGGLSTVITVYGQGITRFDTVFFAYKFAMPILIYKTLENIDFSESQVNRLLKWLLAMYGFLIIWVFLYIYLVSRGLMVGNPRPSLPFNDTPYTSDSPFYSTVLWMFFALYFIIYDGVISKWFKPILFVLAIASALLTGGRSGLVLVASFFFIYKALTFRPYIKRKHLPIYLILLVLSIPALVFAAGKLEESQLIERALNFNLSEDASALGRLGKLQIAMENNLDTGLLLGQGFLTQEIRWYDGSFSTINAYFGLTGVAVIIILFVNFFRTKIFSFKQENYLLFATLFSFTVSYILTNLISDYYLLTRSIFPFLINFVLIGHFFKNKQKLQSA